jgi:hypothetical protein
LWCRKGSPPCKWMLSLLRLWLHLPSPSYIGSPLFFCFVLFGWLNIQLSVVLILTSNSMHVLSLRHWKLRMVELSELSSSILELDCIYLRIQLGFLLSVILHELVF